MSSLHWWCHAFFFTPIPNQRQIMTRTSDLINMSAMVVGFICANRMSDKIT